MSTVEQQQIMLCPGRIKSKNDGDWHYISARQLADLYGVDFNKCKVLNDRLSDRAVHRPSEKYIYLQPMADGNYKRKGQDNE